MCRIDVYQPFHISLDNVDVNLNLFEEDELLESCEHEFRSKVTEHKEIIRSQARSLEPLFPDDMLDPWDFTGKYLEEMEGL